MPETLPHAPTVVCVASFFKGNEFLRECAARGAGLRVPEFVHLLNGEKVAEFLARAQGPWLLKPRTGASAMGMRLLNDAEEVWRAAAELDARAEAGGRAPRYLLERFVRGDVYHVDSLTARGRVVFACASRYGAPPFEVAHKGGVSTSHTLRRGAADERRLLALNKKLLAGLGFESGTTHAEFIRGAEDGEFYFLEAAARLRRRLHLARAAGVARHFPVRRPRDRLPRTQAHHVGLVVRSPRYERATALLEDYRRRFVADFLAVAPPEATARHHL